MNDNSDDRADGRAVLIRSLKAHEVLRSILKA